MEKQPLLAHTKLVSIFLAALSIQAQSPEIQGINTQSYPCWKETLCWLLLVEVLREG